VVNLQNGASTIQELFNGDRIFNIPKYQRTYAWDKENYEAFFDDLKNQRGDKEYFLGTLLFHQKENRKDYEILDIVDGQQRLTTIIIFMKVIVLKLIEMDSGIVFNKTFSKFIYDGENYKLELENENSSFLHESILSKDNKIIKPETPSQSRLMDAMKYFGNRLNSLELERIENLYKVLVNSKVILYIVNQISEATKIFELLNDRGKRLTKLEGIKSYMMYRIGCLNLKDDGEQSINRIQENISKIYRLIEKYEIEETDVLRYHTIAFENCKNSDYNSPEYFIKDKINLLFDTHQEDSTIKDEILNYVERLQESFIIFKEIKENSMKSKELDDLEMIGRIAPFYPLMMYIYKNDNDKFNKFISSLTKFTFRATLIGLRNDNESFYRYIRNKEDIIEKFEEIIDNNWWNINGRVEETLSYRNYYNWINAKLIKYILLKYENYLRKEKGYPLLDKDVFFSKDAREQLSTEHISAQKNEKLSELYDDEFEEIYLHSLGNLVLDTKSSNSRKGNDSTDVKMEEFLKSSLMSQSELNDYNVNWIDIEDVKRFIDERNEKLLEFINEKLM
jgi:hypothetical protein